MGGGATGGGATGGGTTGGGPPPPPDTSADVFGTIHSGNYNNGPVDFAETQWHNACAPKEKYPPQIQQLYGPYLAGVDNSVGGDGSLCDACALVKTPMGKSVVVHIVTYGVSQGPGDLDLSPEAFAVLQEGSSLGTRSMTWQLARCPDKGNMYIEYQTGANPYWTSFWVRNAKLPIASVESKKPDESAFSKLDRTPDGPFTDGNGVGTGSFDLRITSIGGQAVTQTFAPFQPGALVESTVQFP
jgi:expansin (peptidoglycan-binding protein)